MKISGWLAMVILSFTTAYASSPEASPETLPTFPSCAEVTLTPPTASAAGSIAKLALKCTSDTAENAPADAYKALLKATENPGWPAISRTPVGFDVLSELALLAAQIEPQEFMNRYANFRDAVESARRDGEPIPLNIVVRLGQAAQSAGDLSVAEREFTAALRDPTLTSDGRARLQIWLSEVQLHAGTPIDAHATLSKIDLASVTSPVERATFEIEVAEHYETQGDTAAALKHLDLAVADLPITKDNRKLLRDKEWAGILFRSRAARVRIADNSGNFGEASDRIQYLLFATNRERRDSLPKLERRKLLYDVTTFYLNHRDFSSARQWAASILLDYTNNAIPLDELDSIYDIYRRAGLFREAINDFSLLIRGDGTNGSPSIVECKLRWIVSDAQFEIGHVAAAEQTWANCGQVSTDGTPDRVTVEKAFRTSEIALRIGKIDSARNWLTIARHLESILAQSGTPLSSVSSDLLEVKILDREEKPNDAKDLLQKIARRLSRDDQKASQEKPAIVETAMQIADWLDAQQIINASGRSEDPQIPPASQVQTLLDQAIIEFHNGNKPGVKSHLDSASAVLSRNHYVAVPTELQLGALRIWLNGSTPDTKANLDMIQNSRVASSQVQELVSAVRDSLGGRAEQGASPAPASNNCIASSCAIIAHVNQICGPTGTEATYVDQVATPFPTWEPINRDIGDNPTLLQQEQHPVLDYTDIERHIATLNSCDIADRQKIVALLGQLSDYYEGRPAYGVVLQVDEVILALSNADPSAFAEARQSAALAISEASAHLPERSLDPLLAQAAEAISLAPTQKCLRPLVNMTDPNRQTPPPAAVFNALNTTTDWIAQNGTLREQLRGLAIITDHLTDRIKNPTSVVALQSARDTLIVAIARNLDVDPLTLDDSSQSNWRSLALSAPTEFERIGSIVLLRALTAQDGSLSAAQRPRVRRLGRFVLSEAVADIAPARIARMLEASHADTYESAAHTSDARALNQALLVAFIAAEQGETAIDFLRRQLKQRNDAFTDTDEIFRDLWLDAWTHKRLAVVANALETLAASAGAGAGVLQELQMMRIRSAACTNPKEAVIDARKVATEMLSGLNEDSSDQVPNFIAAIRLMERAGQDGDALAFIEKAMARMTPSRQKQRSETPVMTGFGSERVTLLLRLRRFDEAYGVLRSAADGHRLIIGYEQFDDATVEYVYVGLWMLDYGAIDGAMRFLKSARDADQAPRLERRLLPNPGTGLVTQTFEIQEAYRQALLKILGARILRAKHRYADALQEILEGVEPGTIVPQFETNWSLHQTQALLSGLAGSADAARAISSAGHYRAELALSLIADQTAEDRASLRGTAFQLAQVVTSSITARTFASMLDNGGGLRPGSLERERLRYQTARRTSRYNAGGAAFDDSSDALLGTDPCSEPASIRADLRERLGVNDDENGSGEQPEGFAERMEELDPTIAKQKASDTLYSQPLVPWTIPLISLKTVRDGLEADQALLMLVVTNDATTVLGITKDENTDFLRNVAIPSNELKAKIDQLRRSVSGAPLSTLASQRFPLETAAELYTTLLGPWVDSLPASVHKIIYLSSTPLDSLPLDLLVEQLPATLALTEFDDYRQAKWLGDRFELRMLPAVSREAIREKSALSNRTKGDTHFLGFGAPTLTSVDDCSATSAANRSRTVGHLCELPDTEDLLVDLSRVFESNETQKISCDSTATSLAPISPCYVRNAFKQSFLHSEPMRKILSQAGVIAFATHGLTSQEVVALGGDSEPALVATPSAETSGDDGLLSASEIATLNLSADLVILSACNSAASDGNPDSETLSGLGQAFFLAGAKSLLVSSWAIDEKATVALISGLANNLQAGRSTGNALQKSIKTIRDGAGDALPAQYAHPVYWAAFSLVGAP